MNKKYIALTFDDGPDPEITPQVLDILKEHGAKGSFFLIGNNITPETEYLVRREQAEGHEINTHSLTHSDMTKLTDQQILDEMEETERRITAIIGQRPKFFRPPYIAYDERMFRLIDLPFICGIGCNDWDQSVSAEERVQKVLADAADGVMILLHDQQNNQKTVEALKVIVPTLIRQGYELVTLTELFEVYGIAPRSDLPIIYSDVFKTDLY